MTTYANRTCACCGVRKPQPQPQMKLIERYEEAGKGNASFSGMTVLGAVLGSKQSWRSIERSVFNAGERKYSRKRSIWACVDCAETIKAEYRMPITWGKVFMAVVALAFIAITVVGALN